MNLGISSLGIALGLALLLVPAATAQEVLPFPPTPSASTPGLTMQDSVHRKRQLRRACATAPPTS
jgi:arylsulfatase